MRTGFSPSRPQSQSQPRPRSRAPSGSEPNAQHSTPFLNGDQGIASLVGSLDLTAIVVALLLAARIVGAPLDNADPLPAPILSAGVMAAWMLTLKLHGAYVALSVRGGRPAGRAVLLGSLSAAALVAATSWAAEVPVSKPYLALLFSLGGMLLLVSRWTSAAVVRQLWARGRLRRRVVVLGERTPVRDVSSALRREERFSGLTIAATGTFAGSRKTTDDSSSDLLEGADDVVAACREAGADAAVVAGTWGSAEEMRRLSWELADHGIDLFIAPDATEITGARVELLPIAGLPLLHVDRPRVAQSGGTAKRVLDVVLSAAAVVVLAPLVLVITLLIKHEDHGPVYFRQTRVGRQGRPFTLFKFRTMHTDAESHLEELRPLSEVDHLLFKLREDPRVTRVGKHLRRMSLDELPQLFNVLRGDMSLVGPRPPLPSEVAGYEEDVRRRLLVRPGITGLWQVSGRSTLTWSESVRLDLYYVDNWTMASDLVILAKTVRAVLSRRGAY